MASLMADTVKSIPNTLGRDSGVMHPMGLTRPLPSNSSFRACADGQLCRPAISSHSLGRAWVHKLPAKLAYASAAGFQAVEIFHEDLVYHASDLFQKADISLVTPEDRIAAAKDISKFLVRCNLTVVCLQPFRNYEGLLDPTAHAEKLADFRIWVRMAHILNTGLIAIASSLESPDSTTGDPERLASDLAVLADIGAAANPPIRVSYEALCFGTHVQSWEQSWGIVKRANRPNLGLCLDTFNIAGWAYADPGIAGGARPDGRVRMQQSLQTLQNEVPKDQIFYIQVVDAQQMLTPLQEGHPLYVPGQPSRMTWSRACRLFYGETQIGAYLPIQEIIDVVLRGIGWRGWISMELFNKSLEEKSDDVPEAHARRGIMGWGRLLQDFPELSRDMQEGFEADHALLTDDISVPKTQAEPLSRGVICR